MASSSVKGRVLSFSKGDLRPTDIQGAVQVALDYDETFGEFNIYVRQCKNLAVADGRKDRTDPYVKTYLVPDSTQLGKRKTSVRKRTVNPTFQEMLKYKIEKMALIDQKLNLSVWHNDLLGHNILMGEIEIDLANWDWDKRKLIWYTLRPRVPVRRVNGRPAPQPAFESPQRIPPFQQEVGHIILRGNERGRCIPPPVVHVTVGTLGGGSDEIPGAIPMHHTVYGHPPQAFPEYLHVAFVATGDGRDGIVIQARQSQVIPENHHQQPTLMAHARRYHAIPEDMMATLVGVSDERFAEGRRGVTAPAHSQSWPYGTRAPEQLGMEMEDLYLSPGTKEPQNSQVTLFRKMKGLKMSCLSRYRLEQCKLGSRKD